MKTMSKRLIAEAEKLEAQAQALRVAAGVMNGHEHIRKQTSADSTVQQAVKLRKEQRNGGPPEPPEGVDINSLVDAAYAYRQAVVLHFLQDGPQPMPAIRAHLHAHGISKLKSIGTMLRKMPGVRCKGFARGAVWMLRKSASV